MCDTVAKLLPVIVEVVKVLRGVPKEVEEINEELHRIEGCINVADRMTAAAGQDNKMKVKELREAALRIEDVTEDYMITQQHQPPRDPGCAAILCAAADFIKTMILRLRISYEIQDIKSSVVEIEERSKRFGSQIQSSFEQGSSSSAVPWHSLREEAWYLKEDKVVGFEEPSKELMGWLLDKRPELSVTCVVGMGGQGKTTLAKTVFDKVIGEFDCGACITVPPDYTVEDLLREVLNKLCEGRNEPPPKDISQMDRKTLTDKVRNYLKQKRYVILFDDVWKKEFWSEIRFAVLDDNKKSRVLITTRKMKVANFCNETPILHIHKLQPLSSQQSLKLFYKKAFQNEPGGHCPTELEHISSKIVEKCEGLPLAIVAIGGLLARKEKDSDEWEELYQTLNAELDKDPNVTGITNILGLSYNDLPYHLKSCFLYFGIYPKDYEVGSKRLIRQWIAERFVKFESRKTLEKVGEQYLNELVDRNLVQVSSFSIDGKPKRCRVHDLLRDIILTKIKDISFCHFVSDAKDDRSMFSWKIRRLQIATKSNDDLKITSIEGSLVRSLYVFREKKLSMDLVKIIPTKCKRLKVFDFQDNWLKYIPGNFGSLIQLRYLSFRNTKVRNLPESIGNLRNLETLDLRGTFVRKLPTEINKLRKLQHLLYKHNIPWNDGGVQMMGGVAGLESLQTLHKVETGDNGEELIKELEKLIELRCLGLVNVKPEYVSPLCSSINKMQQHLEKLYIRLSEDEGSTDWDCISSLPVLQKLSLIGRLERFPEWIPEQKNLVKLNLWYSNLSDDPLKALSSLPKLLALSLSSAYRGETLHFQNRGFQKLQRLVLRSLGNLNCIQIDEGALPLLKELVLNDIPELKEVPSGFNHLNLGTLEVFDISRMSEEFNVRAEENGLYKKWIRAKIAYLHLWKKVLDFTCSGAGGFP